MHMTENEAIDELQRIRPYVEIVPQRAEALDVAIKALEEIQRWHTSEVNPNIKNVFANMSTQICHNCDHKDEYIEELEAEIEQYRAIGTPEECLRNKDFLDYLSDKMNPNDFETYLHLYNALEEKGCEE